MHAHTSTCVHISTRLCACVYMGICTHVCTCLHVCVCSLLQVCMMCAWVCVHTCMHTHLHTQKPVRLFSPHSPAPHPFGGCRALPGLLLSVSVWRQEPSCPLPQSEGSAAIPVPHLSARRSGCEVTDAPGASPPSPHSPERVPREDGGRELHLSTRAVTQGQCSEAGGKPFLLLDPCPASGLGTAVHV